MAKYIAIAVFFLALLFPHAISAQDSTTVNVDALVEELNAECPIDFGDEWGINSFTMVGDRYALVDVLLPANLSMVLGMLSDESSDNVKRVWIKQLNYYGKKWNDFVNAMVNADRRIVVNLRPKGSKETALITFLPSDFQRYSSSDKSSN